MAPWWETGIELDIYMLNLVNAHATVKSLIVKDVHATSYTAAM